MTDARKREIGGRWRGSDADAKNDLARGRAVASEVASGRVITRVLGPDGQERTRVSRDLVLDAIRSSGRG